MLEIDNKVLEKGATLDIFLAKKKKATKAPTPKPATKPKQKKR